MTKKELDRLQADMEAAATALKNHRNYYRGPEDDLEWLYLDRARLMARQEAYYKAAAAYHRAIRECMVIKVKDE